MQPSKKTPATSETIHPLRTATLFAVIYGVFGLVWVLLSDELLFALVSDPGAVRTISAAKGSIFVLISCLGLFALTYIYLASLRAAEVSYQLQRRTQELSLRQGYVDVLDAVTGGRLILVTGEELEALLGRPVSETARLEQPEELAETRRRMKPVLMELGVGDVDSAMLAVSEAITNGLKHGTGCEHEIRSLEDAVQVIVRDKGPGIDFRSLPKATLIQGYSTTGTMGLGFTIMMEVSDRLLLCTDETGTTVVLELGLQRAEPPEPRLPKLLEA